MQENIKLRPIKKADCLAISQAFEKQGWDKPVAQYENYLLFQKSGERDVIVACVNNEFVGYLTVKWTSDYPYFKEKNIPEIVDFNVLKKYQRLGIGSKLMDEAETRIRRVSPYAGIGVGLYSDYGPAQILYSNRGYRPDGNGLVKDHFPLQKGSVVAIDDSIALYFVKEI